MSSRSILAWNNYLASAVLSTGSASPGLPGENLQNDTGSPSTAWQTAAGVKTTAGGAFVTAKPATTGQTWRVFGVFGTNLTAAATVTVALYNNPSTLVWTTSASGPAAGYRQVVIVAPSDKVADYCTIAFDDVANPDGFVNVPLAFAGPAWLPLTAPSWQSKFGRDDRVDETVSRGGQEYPNMLWERRRWDIILNGVRGTEVWTDIGELDRIARRGGNNLFIPDYASSDINRESVFGRLMPTADVTFPYEAADRRSWSARITERL